MQIAITGSSGILGSSFTSFFEKQSINFFTVNRENYNPKISINEVINYFQSQNTSIIIHCAANTDVELCENNEKKCFHDNYKLTEVLAEVSKKLNSKLIFISSTGVYGNYKSNPYIESDIATPTTIYHKSKLDAEKMIQKTLENYLIIRTGWLFGGNINSPKNFVMNRLKEARNSNGEISSNLDQRGNPTYTNDLVKNIYTLINNNVSGLFNCVNKGNASRFDYVSEIIKLSGHSVNVNGVQKSAFDRKANVSNNEMALNFNLSEIELNQMPEWQPSLKKYISSLDSLL
tara:strand:- start:728 stop:1594 length:867 start_codon:yes stop_codon:yes gene_type:complete